MSTQPYQWPNYSKPQGRPIHELPVIVWHRVKHGVYLPEHYRNEETKS